jgi:hypothetical protein
VLPSYVNPPVNPFYGPLLIYLPLGAPVPAAPPGPRSARATARITRVARANAPDLPPLHRSTRHQGKIT